MKRFRVGGHAMSRWWVTVAVALAAGAGIVCTGGSQAASSKRPVTVPIQIRDGVGTSIGARPWIKVKVGNGPTVPVLLDTGSVGLHIYAPGVRTGAGSGVTRTGMRIQPYTYVDGTVQTGVLAKAKLTIGSVSTSKAVPFGLITRVGCVPSKPDCPTKNGIKAAVRKGEYGVMGVRFQPVPSGTPGNPLVSLPAPYSNRWSMAFSGHSSRLVLGAPVIPGTVLHFAGSPPKVTVCWTIGSIQNVCEHTIFDSGNPVMVVFGGPLATAPKPGSTVAS